ncbi:MAG: hypothetical protein ABSB09_12410 [Acidimicrobiales bacterium]
MRGEPGRRLAVALAVVGLAAALLAGCTTARSDLGTADESCYLGLPAASQAVDGHGRLTGVDLMDASALRKKAPILARTLVPERATTSRFCVFAFTGNFERAKVARPYGRPSGRLAVVVLAEPSLHLLGTFLFRNPPLQFGHAHSF